MTRSIQKADVFAFSILPDHMHILLRPGIMGLSKFMQSFKSNATLDIHQLLGSRPITVAGSRDSRLRAEEIQTADIFWQAGFHDERIRDAAQRTKALSYIQENAVKHQFVTKPEDWPWTSLHFVDRLDPLDIWI